MVGTLEGGYEILRPDLAAESDIDPVEDDEVPELDPLALRRVPDVLPLSAWLVIVIELCERFAYFGLSGPLQNYIQNPRDNPLRPGGLGIAFSERYKLNSI